MVSLSCILYHLYWVKSIPLARPSSPGLPQGMSMFGLGLGRKIRHSIALFHADICLFLSWNTWISLHREGKGIMVLLHGENTVDLAIWSFLYMYMPFTILIVSSMPTVSIGSPVCIGLKIKLLTGLISLAIFLKSII